MPFCYINWLCIVLYYYKWALKWSSPLRPTSACNSGGSWERVQYRYVACILSSDSWKTWPSCPPTLFQCQSLFSQHLLIFERMMENTLQCSTCSPIYQGYGMLDEYWDYVTISAYFVPSVIWGGLDVSVSRLSRDVLMSRLGLGSSTSLDMSTWGCQSVYCMHCDVIYTVGSVLADVFVQLGVVRTQPGSRWDCCSRVSGVRCPHGTGGQLRRFLQVFFHRRPIACSYCPRKRRQYYLQHHR